MNNDLDKILNGCKKRRSGDQKALYEYCYPHMMKVCLRYTQNIDEAASFYNTAMFKVFTNIEQYRNEGEFMGWVRRIIVNTCISTIKQNARFEYKEINQETENEKMFQPEVYQHLSAKQILEQVQQLPENMRLVFNLSVIEGYTHDKIAETLSISKGTSKWYLHEARKHLKEKIKALFNYETNSNAV